MNELCRLLLLSIGLISIGCNGSSPPPTPPAQGHTWGDPIDWVNDPPAVTSVEFSDLPLEDPKLKDRLVRWGTTAEKLQDEDWFHHSWYKRGKVSYVQWWSSVPEHVHPQGYIEGGAHDQPGEVHHVLVEYVRRQSQKSDFGVLHIDWMPAKSGWGVSLNISTENSIRFWPRDLKDKNVGVVDFYQGFKEWKREVTFEGVNYHLLAKVRSAKPSDDKDAKSRELERLVEWSSSVAAFRLAGLSMLDELEQSVKSGIASGSAIDRAYIEVQEPGSGTDGGNPPRYMPEPSSRALTAEEKDGLLVDAIEDLNQRRLLFEKHYPAMHAALKKAFPANGF